MSRAPKTIATPTPAVTRQPAPTATATATITPGAIVYQGHVQVSNIHYQGVELNEADEYVEIKNIGTQAVPMDGWSLKVLSPNNVLVDQYVFSNGFILAVGQTCHIYTAKLSNADNCGTGHGFDSATPLWPNTPGQGWHASLYDKNNVEQARFTY